MASDLPFASDLPTSPLPSALVCAEDLRPCCGCGCGAPVARRFLPGHDARLKSALTARSLQGDQAAILAMAAEGWAHYLPASLLSTVPTRLGRGRAHLAHSRLASSLAGCGVVVDERGIAHSRYCCPASPSPSRPTGRFFRLPLAVAPTTDAVHAAIYANTPAVWTCGTCIHLSTFADIVRDEALLARMVTDRSGAYQTHESDPDSPSGLRLLPQRSPVRSRSATLAAFDAPSPDPDPSPLSHLVTLEDCNA